MVRIVLVGMRGSLDMRVGMGAAEGVGRRVEASDSGEGEKDGYDPCDWHVR